jgi:tetratricopeptide (TPR) repeat protein
LALYERVVQAQPENFEAQFWLAAVYASNEVRQYDKAFAVAHRAASLKPRSASACLLMGYVNAKAGHFHRAIPYFEKALHTHPPPTRRERWRIYYWLSESLRKQSKFRQAKEFAIKAVNLAPTDEDTLIMAAKNCICADDFRRAESYCQKVLQLDGREGTAHAFLGVVCHWKGDTILAFKHLLLSLYYGSKENLGWTFLQEAVEREGFTPLLWAIPLAFPLPCAALGLLLLISFIWLMRTIIISHRRRRATLPASTTPTTAVSPRR